MQLIVLGNHRSGTSALARILNLMGCYFGSEESSVGAGRDNPKGFWERLDVVELNDFILSSAGGSWWDLEKLNLQAITAGDRADIEKKLGDIIIKLEAHRPWFIKDPRLCLTLPFWLPHLERPFFLYAVRSPLQITRSLEERNGMPLNYALMLWEYYTRLTFHHLGKRPFLPLSYERLLSDPYSVSLQLYEELKRLGVAGLNQPDRQEIESFVDPALCHFGGEDETAGLDPIQQQLYRASSSGIAPSFDPGRAVDLQAAMAAEKKSGSWVEKLKVIEEQDYLKSLTKLDLRKTISDLEKEISEQEEENTDLKRHIGDLDDRLDVLEAQNSDLRDHLNDRDRRISALENRLRALIDSRLIGAFASLYRAAGLGSRGLAAETARIRALLSSDDSHLQVKPEAGPLSPRGGRAALVARLSVAALRHPLVALKALRPGRLKKIALLVFSGDLGRHSLPPLTDGQGLQPYREVIGALSGSTEALPGIAQELITRYDLPRSSRDRPPVPPAEKQAKEWAEGIFSLEEGLPPLVGEPSASIIIPVHNQLAFTMACLESILCGAGRNDYEIIIADDASSDLTPLVFEGREQGRIRYLRSAEAAGFNENCRRGAAEARGRNLVFLNNDTVVLQDWLKELIDLLENDPSVGLAGSCLLYPENLLQEAGGIIFSDGSGWNYGRFQPPGEPRYNYLRDSDYCSAASLAVSTALWKELQGFDPRFSPAYYEDTDLAFRVREKGRRVVYQPLSRLVHFEGVSHGKSEQSGIKRYQVLNREKFVEKWRHVLALQEPGHDPGAAVGRGLKGRILAIDATTPTPDRDSGSMDLFNYLRIFKNLGYHVTFVPQNIAHAGRYTGDLQRIGVECLHAPWVYSAREAVERYAPHADMVFLSRCNVAANLLDVVRRANPEAKVVFDTVDVHFLRESREAEVLRSARRRIAADKTRRRELEVIGKADLTLLRSSYELDIIGKLLPSARLRIMPIVREIPGLVGGGWEERSDIAFIGGFLHPPNLDAVKYFVREVWPCLRRASFPGRLVIAGSSLPPEIEALGSEEIIIRGFVPDLASLFSACRLTIAPLRYGAGVKGKVVTSLSYGVPCVATSVAAEGSGFENGRHLLVEDEPRAMAEAVEKLYTDRKLWEKLSAGGLEYCHRYYSLSAVQDMMEKMLRELEL